MLTRPHGRAEDALRGRGSQMSGRHLGKLDGLMESLGRLKSVWASQDIECGVPPDAFRVVDAVRQFCPNVLAVTGNLDMPQVIDAFRARGISLHGEGRRLGDLGIFGCGGSNITPMDTPTEFEEDELRAVLERGHAAVAEAPRRLMICHTPPFDTQLDRLVNGRPVGSPAVRAFLEARRPDLAVVGHIHEGRGADRVGATLVLNAGALRDGGYVVVEDGADGLTAELRNFRAARA